MHPSRRIYIYGFVIGFAATGIGGASPDAALLGVFSEFASHTGVVTSGLITKLGREAIERSLSEPGSPAFGGTPVPIHLSSIVPRD